MTKGNLDNRVRRLEELAAAEEAAAGVDLRLRKRLDRALADGSLTYDPATGYMGRVDPWARVASILTAAWQRMREARRLERLNDDGKDIA